jgi:hypothetical protein
VTEPIDPQRDGSERERRAPNNPDTGPEALGADADAAAPDASSETAPSAEVSGDGGADPVADDPEQADEQVAVALAELDAAADWPPADQVAAFIAAHETLRATLARIDDH